MNQLASFSLNAARSYVQSVVFIDDEIYDHHKASPISLEGLDVPGIPDQFASSVEDQSPTLFPVSGEVISEDSGSGPNPNGYSSKSLTQGFANKGIVCGLYEPERNVTAVVGSPLFKVCERADIVILDWEFYEDRGKAAIQLINNLIIESRKVNPDQLGLLVIYTMTPHLSRVIDQLRGQLKQQGHPVQDIDRTAIVVYAFRIRVFGKPGSTGRIADEKEWEVEEEQIADRVLTEFASIYQGLLPAFALHGMASIRHNSKRILDKFSASMDGAYLLHRALSLTTADALGQLPELISDEIRAVVEDEQPSDDRLQQLAFDASNIAKLTPPIESWKSNGKAVDFAPIVRRYLSLGVQGIQNDALQCAEAKKIIKDPKSMMAALTSIVNGEDENSNERLAALFASRSQYGLHRPLTYGTIVSFKGKDETFNQFALCIIPICDSVRLTTEKSRFPFWTLADDVYLHRPKRTGLVFETSNRTTKALTASGKIANRLWFEEFDVNATTRTVTAELKDDKFTYTSKDYDIEWVGQLKPLHVQRIAQDVAQAFSRVGLNEAEWLRLLCG